VRAIVAWYGPAAAVLIAAWSTGSLAPQEAALHLADGTRIRVRLSQFISSETSTPGDPVHLAIAEDVAVDGSVAIKRGALATGTILEAAPVTFGRRGWFWRPRLRTGRLVVGINETHAVDGQMIRLRTSPVKSSDVLVPGVVVATPPRALLRWAHEGTGFDAFVDGDYVVRGEGFGVRSRQHFLVAAAEKSSQGGSLASVRPPTDDGRAAQLHHDGHDYENRP